MAMRKLLATVIVFVAAAFAVPAASAAALKIGFVNVQQIMATTPQAEAARAQLKKEFGDREKRLTAQHDVILKQEADLKRNAAVMATDKKNAAEKALREKMVSFNQEMATFRNDFNLKRNELLQGLQKRIYAAIVKVAKDGNYDLVLSNGVVYASNQVNLTKQVLAELAKSKN